VSLPSPSLLLTESRPGLAIRVTLFCLISVGWNGYVFGRADHGIHLVFVDRILHPDRWTGDFLDQAAAHHPSLLWWIEAAASSLLGMPLAFFLLHAAALICTGTAIERLVRSLGGQGRAALAALLILAPAQFALGGVATLDPLLLPRGAALPLELLALAWLIEQRFGPAFALLGAAACLHAPSASGLAVAACVLLAGRGELQLRRMWFSPGLFFVGALPVICLWAASGSASGILTQVDDAWMAIIDLRLARHIDPSSWPLSEWMGMAAWLGAGALAIRHARGLDPDGRRSLLLLAFGLILWAGVGGTFLARHLRLALALQLEPWECFRFVTLLAGCALGIWAEGRPRLGPAGFAGIAGIALLISHSSFGHDPRWEPTGPEGPKVEFVRQIADELPPGSLVAWPPGGFESLRWQAALPGTPTWKDGGEALFDRALAMEWLESMRTLCACDPLGARGGQRPSPGADRLMLLRRELNEGWDRRTATDIMEAARRIGATHCVQSEAQLEASDTATGASRISAGGWALVSCSEPRR
jgi:hypothetical protein